MPATLAPAREPGSPAPASSRRRAERVFRIREVGIVAVLIVFVAVTAAIQPRFLNSSNIQFVLVDATIYALLALGETLVVITRNVDLSVGSVLGISAFACAKLASATHGVALPLVFGAGLGIGLGFGVINGLVGAPGRVPSLVVTLATLYIIRGIDVLAGNGGQVGPSSP